MSMQQKKRCKGRPEDLCHLRNFRGGIVFTDGVLSPSLSLSFSIPLTLTLSLSLSLSQSLAQLQQG
jgi:hypothetical protein